MGTRNVAAEEWLRAHSATLVSNIIADQQAAICAALSEGLTGAGSNPTRSALDIVGRVNRVTGKGEG